jgi:hypothetical protein
MARRNAQFYRPRCSSVDSIAASPFSPAVASPLRENGCLRSDNHVLTPKELICSVLRGEGPSWPWAAEDEQPIDAIYRQAELHGVEALLHSHLNSLDWPAPLLQSLRTAAVQQAMWELRHQQLLAQTLHALHGSGIEPVLIKGSALAYSLYPNPVLRTRADTDLIISARGKQRVHEMLLHLGYVRGVGVSGNFVSYQASYTQEIDGALHTLDLHWKINNSELLSKLFTYEELRETATPLPRLSPDAVGASPVAALLLACMHRSTHKQNPYYVNGTAMYEGNRLIWLYDIHLLAGCLNEQQWQQFCALAQRKQLRAVCLDGMRHASACFHTVFPDHVIATLGRPGPREAPDRYLDGGKLRQQSMDFHALGGGLRQVQFLRELFFPAPAYMRAKYAHSGFSWLPWLYGKRAAGGIVKALSRR